MPFCIEYNQFKIKVSKSNWELSVADPGVDLRGWGRELCQRGGEGGVENH